MVGAQENFNPKYFDDLIVQRITADERVFDTLYQGRISYSNDPNVSATDSILGSWTFFEGSWLVHVVGMVYCSTSVRRHPWQGTAATDRLPVRLTNTNQDPSGVKKIIV